MQLVKVTTSSIIFLEVKNCKNYMQVKKLKICGRTLKMQYKIENMRILNYHYDAICPEIDKNIYHHKRQKDKSAAISKQT